MHTAFASVSTSNSQLSYTTVFSFVSWYQNLWLTLIYMLFLLLTDPNRNDTGVFVLQLMLSYNGDTHFHFREVRLFYTVFILYKTKHIIFPPLCSSPYIYFSIDFFASSNLFWITWSQEHAKPIREVITYYLCTHSENEAVMPQIKNIAAQYVSVYLIIP
jgi:hypothetical protein